MKYNLEGLISVLTLNQSAMDKEYKTLQSEVDKANAFVRADKPVKNEEALKESQKSIRKYAEKCAALELLVNKCKELKTADLTDEQAKRALCKARQYSTWVAKQNKETGCFALTGRQTDYDITAILADLGIDTGFKSDIGLLAVCLALRVAEKIEDKDKDRIVNSFKMNDKVREKINAGADLSSKRSAVLAVQDVLNAFLPEANYKAVNKDWEWFMLGSTALDKKTLGGIKVANTKTVEKMVYDYVCLLERNGGTAQYKATYKAEKEEVPAPTEPKSEEPKVESPAAEPVKEESKPEEKAAKPAKEPKAKAEKKSATKRGSKKSKETVAA